MANKIQETIDKSQEALNASITIIKQAKVIIEDLKRDNERMRALLDANLSEENIRMKKALGFIAQTCAEAADDTMSATRVSLNLGMCYASALRGLDYPEEFEAPQ